MPNPEDYKVYIGDLGNDGSKSELEEAFGYYGRLKNVWVASNPPGFAFVEFEDDRDAEDAVRGLDGQKVCGRKVRVEMAKPRRGRGGGGGGFSRRGGGGGGGGGGSMDCYKCGQQGHMARDCRSNVDGGYRRDGGGGGGGGRSSSFSCYQCGESGHMARDCRGSGGGGYRRDGSSGGGGGGGGGGGRRGRSPSPRRRRSPSYSRSRSRSPNY